jgi:hypothetical protein
LGVGRRTCVVSGIIRAGFLSPIIRIGTIPIHVWRIRPPILPIIIPIISAWVIFPVGGFFDIGSHTDLNGGRSRQRRIDIIPGHRAEHTKAQQGEEEPFRCVYSLWERFLPEVQANSVLCHSIAQGTSYNDTKRCTPWRLPPGTERLGTAIVVTRE